MISDVFFLHLLSIGCLLSEKIFYKLGLFELKSLGGFLGLLNTKLKVNDIALEPNVYICS